MIEKNQLIGIRWHGRGGQGSVTSAELVARAAISEGKYAQAFPSFGPERRGAPVLSFVRISRNTPLRIRAEITEPDVVVILDPGLLPVVNVTAGLKSKGIVVINTKKGADHIRREFGIIHTIAAVDATKIALEEMKRSITNTCMLGAFARATGWIQLDSILSCLEEYIAGSALQKNKICVQRGYEETNVSEF